MSQNVTYPTAQQPAVLESSNHTSESQQNNESQDTHNSLMASQSCYAVAQLSVVETETQQAHQGSNVFTRSQSLPITDDVPQSCVPGVASDESRAVTVAKIENIKNWSISTYKCTKQLISEKLGKSSRTVDTELESQIELLRDVQRKYLNILRLARALSSHFQHVVSTQQGLGEAFSDLAQKSPELQSEFLCNAETQRSLSRHGEALLTALNFFVSSVNTLVNKTMEDTLQTVKRYETARIEYDAYRSDLEVLLQSTSTGQSSALADAQRAHDEHKIEFEKIRADLSIKLRFLNENRVKVMHKQLLLFHNAVSAYFSGNQTALEATLKQFNIKMKTGNIAPTSWLEQ